MTGRKPVSPSPGGRRDALRAAIRRALAGGAQPSDVVELVSASAGDQAPDRATIGRMVNTIQKEVAQARQKRLQLSNAGAGQAGDDGAVYLDPNNLPPGVFLAKDLAAKYGVTPQAIRNWIQSGRITEVGRVKGKAGGHGGFLAVREADVVFCKANPRKGGRPRKRDKPAC